MPIRIWGKAPDENAPEASLKGYLGIADKQFSKLYREPVASTAVRKLRVSVDREPGDFLWVGVLLIFSSRLVDTVRKLGVNAEFVPIALEIRGVGRSSQPFFIANIMEQVDCLDRMNGHYTYWPDGSVDEVLELAIDQEAAEGHRLFWVKDAPPILLCASQETQDAVRAAGHSGIAFREPERWKVISEWS
jgi:hypothetical protein